MPTNTDSPTFVPSQRNQEVKQVIDEYLQDVSLKATTTASRLFEMVHTPSGQFSQVDKPADRAWRIGLEIYYAALDPPSGDESLQRLVKLVATMKEDPRAEQSLATSTENEAEFFTSYIWSGRDLLNRLQDMSISQWRNLQAFLAIEWACGVQNYDNYAIWCLRQELETDQEDESYRDKTTVSASLAWVTFVGQLMYQSDKVWEPTPTTGDPARTGPLLKAQHPEVRHGFSKERWQFWKERFQTFADSQDVDETVRADARSALEKMKDAES